MAPLCVREGGRDLLTYLGDFDLDGSVVLGDDEAVGSGALSWNVLVLNFTLFVEHL